MTIAVDLGRKATKQTNYQSFKVLGLDTDQDGQNGLGPNCLQRFSSSDDKSCR